MMYALDILYMYIGDEVIDDEPANTVQPSSSSPSPTTSSSIENTTLQLR